MSAFSVPAGAPAGLRGASLAISGSRAGGIGVLNAELANDLPTFLSDLETVATHAHGPFGVKLDRVGTADAEALVPFAVRGLRWLIVDLEALASCADAIANLRLAGVSVLAEVRTPDPGNAPLDGIDGLLLKGNECGGFARFSEAGRGAVRQFPCRQGIAAIRPAPPWR